MAANFKRGGGIASLGKRLLNRTSTLSATPSPPPAAAVRCAHSSAYDKNLDDQVHATVVPDDVIQPQSDKYWAPNPQTGVFGPAAEQLNASVGGEQGINSGGENSVLEEKAWFRPTSIEDLEKPHHH
ncbi:Pentatricopeptide repeat-containing protein, putative isoform 1 [Hibiscus syriacus]|uniref:Pentatricopeptide repeat-containing protein, putative isoform 1 n=1 Tax=Hibiscus syriacus TaxID=106335 RepID=A0A6A2Y987_HIBSY|nr:late embryogenesis abundant protein At5g17165-like isoform X2 [Hibiscus syriacus]KAE8673726.1 Pentatricopeptide repeat-containing protein, putative isoform 1 [Hibiscus syriacus]